MTTSSKSSVDPRSGFSSSTSIFHSKRKPVPLPIPSHLDVTTFISSRCHSGTTAFIDASSDRRLSFSDLWRSVASLASSLSSSFSIRKGDVVLLLSPNSLHFPVVSLAVFSLGAILTTTNPLNTPQEIAKQIADSSPAVAFTIPPLLHKITSSSLPIILLEDDHGIISNDDSRVVSNIGILISSGPVRSNRRSEPVNQDDPATLLYSSGTTGASKGVVSSHRNLISMVQIILNRFKLDGENEPETFICTVPMFHVYGLAAFAAGLLGSGSTVVILSKFEMGEMARAIRVYGATYLPIVPPILVAMLGAGAGLELGPLRRILSGGAPVGREVIEGFRERYPAVEILQGYGLTESTGIGASTDTAEESRRYGTAGRLSPNTEARIVEPETGVSLPVNRTGELWLRGPYIMRGNYLRVSCS